MKTNNKKLMKSSYVEVLKKICLVIFGIVAFIIISNIILQKHIDNIVKYDYYIYDKESYKAISNVCSNCLFNVQGKDFKMNNEGFRDDNFTFQKAKNITRIAIIGDSFTWGFGLNNTEDSYPKILEVMLNNISSNRYEVMNFGVPGLNFLDIYLVYIYKVKKFQPDIVIYGMFSNDLEFEAKNTDIMLCQKLFRKDTPDIFTLIHTYGKVIMVKKKWNFANRETGMMWYQQTLDEYPGKECFLQAMASINKDAGTYDSRFIVFVIPATGRPDDMIREFNHNIDTALRSNHIDMIDSSSVRIWQSSKGYNDSEIYIDQSNKEYHFTRKMNTIIAKIILEKLANKA